MGCVSQKPLNRVALPYTRNPYAIYRQNSNPINQSKQDAQTKPSMTKDISLEHPTNSNPFVQKSLHPQGNTSEEIQGGAVLQALLSKIDRRKKKRQQIKYPYDCIAMLTFKNDYEQNSIKYSKAYVGTGFLIARNLLITSAHFIQNYKKIGNNDLSIMFSQHTGQTYESACYKAKIAAAVAFNDDYDSFTSNVSEDYALVFLKNEIARDKYIKLGIGFMQSEVQAHIYGYSSETFNRDFGLIGMKESLKSIKNDIIQYDIDTTVGQSGSPIIIEFTNGEYLAIGIHSGKEDRDLYNSGCYITKKVAQDVKKWVREFIQKSCEESTFETDKTSLYYNEQMRHLNLIDVQNSCLRISNELNQLKLKEISAQDKEDDYEPFSLKAAQKYYEEEKHHQSLVLAQKILTNKDIKEEQRSQGLYLLGLNYRKLQQYDISLYYLSEYISSQIILNRESKRNIIQGLNNIGSTYLEMNEVQKAKTFFNQSKRLCRESMDERNKSRLSDLMNEGSICLSQGKHQKAYSLYESAKKLAFELSEFIDEDKITILQNLANSCHYLSKYNQWLQYFYGSLWMMAKMGHESHSKQREGVAVFVGQVEHTFDRLEGGLQLKVGRIVKLLKISELENERIAKQLRFLLDHGEVIK